MYKSKSSSKWANQAVNVIKKIRLIFLLLSISGIVKAGSNIPFTNMNTNTKYMCYSRHKQASVNRWTGK